MKQNARDKGPSFLAAVMDILGNALSRADDSVALGEYLTGEVRGLTGAGCVLIIQCLCNAAGTAHRVVSVNPSSRREWAESPAANRLCETSCRMSAEQLRRKEKSSEIAGLLRQEGFELSMIFPLDAGAFRAGAMFVLGLPDEERISSVFDLLNKLCAVAAMVLRNAALCEKQDQLVMERTAELRDYNEKLAIELTECKRTDEALRDAYEYIRQLISSANVMIVGLDAAGNVRMFNRAAEEITGYTLGELQEIDWFEKIVPKDRYAWVWEIFRDYQQKTGSMPVTLENPILTKSGEERYIAWQNSTISTPGAEISTISFGIDITGRKLAEAKLREQREFLKKTIESLTHPFYVVDAADYTIVMANAAAGFHVSAGENTCYALTHGRDKPCCGDNHLCPLEIVKRTKKPATMEHTHCDKEGNTRFFEVHGYPVLDDDGNVVQMIEYALDITERKRAEEDLRRINEELDLRVRERTSELERKIAEIERINKLFVGRELRMIELKKRMKELEGGPER